MRAGRAQGSGPQLRPGGRAGRAAGREDAGADLGEAAAAGGPRRRLCGSARNFRRLVAEAKQAWRRDHHRGRRPGVWAPGETLIIDWGVLAGLHVFCAVLAWSRFRFVRFADNEQADHDLAVVGGVFRGPRRRPAGGAGRPDGLPEGRGGRQRGGADRRTMSGSPPTTGSGPISATARIRSRRGSWRTWSAMPRPT